MRSHLNNKMNTEAASKKEPLFMFVLFSQRALAPLMSVHHRRKSAIACRAVSYAQSVRLPIPVARTSTLWLAAAAVPVLESLRLVLLLLPPRSGTHRTGCRPTQSNRCWCANGCMHTCTVPGGKGQCGACPVSPVERYGSLQRDSSRESGLTLSSRSAARVARNPTG